jgi:hypothetical protein
MGDGAGAIPSLLPLLEILVTCTYGGQCPKCVAPPDQLGKYIRFPLCNNDQAQETYLLADGDVHTVGIVQCKIDFYLNFIRKVSQKCLECCCVKYCKAIYNVLYNKERLLPPDTL